MHTAGRARVIQKLDAIPICRVYVLMEGHGRLDAFVRFNSTVNQNYYTGGNTCHTQEKLNLF